MFLLANRPLKNKRIQINTSLLEVKCERQAPFVSPSIHKDGNPYSALDTGEIAILNENQLDELLFGGIESNAITEFYGSAGVGKSQICYTLAVMAAQNKKNGEDNALIYINTEGKFRPERLVTIARSRGLDMHTTNWLSNILCVNATTSYQQEVFLKYTLNSLLENKQRTISLLVVDSIINNYRAEFLGSGNLAERQQRL